ncbi:TetR/AcrR family transcriptional regulator [Cellulomonas soli]|uniref:TetR/AcrR family transcriptional regulator n=1 Tax=Cellulomonas soli TaxID=931535 RepID=UPI003F828033
MTASAPAGQTEPPAGRTVVGRPGRDGGQSPVAARILEIAAARFYTQGIRAVSADALIAEVGVTKATFYRHFPTKDDLVVAYLTAVAEREEAQLDAWAGERPDDPAHVLRTYARAVGAQACSPGFHGCPFINAAAEYPDPQHPVRLVVEQHRRHLLRTAADLLARLGVPEPDRIALQLGMLRDGAMVAGDVGTPEAVTEALVQAGTALVRAARNG